MRYGLFLSGTAHLMSSERKGNYNDYLNGFGLYFVLPTREDLVKNRSSTSPCVSYEATAWGVPQMRPEKPRPRVTTGVAR
jgi:hypothetical protein